jgi:hypothetical protein
MATFLETKQAELNQYLEAVWHTAEADEFEAKAFEAVETYLNLLSLKGITAYRYFILGRPAQDEGMEFYMPEIGYTLFWWGGETSEKLRTRSKSYFEKDWGENSTIAFDLEPNYSKLFVCSPLSSLVSGSCKLELVTTKKLRYKSE